MGQDLNMKCDKCSHRYVCEDHFEFNCKEENYKYFSEGFNAIPSKDTVESPAYPPEAMIPEIVMVAAVNTVGYLALCLQRYDIGRWSADMVLETLREEVFGFLSELEGYQDNISEIEDILAYEIAEGEHDLENFLDFLNTNKFNLTRFYRRVFAKAGKAACN